VEETRRYLNADSLAYLSIEGLLRCVHPRGGDFCTACFTGKYPIPVHRVEPQLWLFQELKASEHRA
jgi:amidophosphoribosyltransferase